LPLQGDCARRGSTLFLDPTTLEPWPDQWSFLCSIARLSADAVSQLAESLRPADAGPALSLEALARADGPSPPAVIRARLDGMLSIARAGMPPAVLAALKHLASLANPEFYEKAADAVLYVGHASVHLLLSRGPRMAPPAAWPHRTGH
jgi:hypothetical protein